MRSSRAGFHVLVATDGSRQGRAAVETAAAFPWPRRARASGVVARGGLAEGRLPARVAAALEQRLARVAAAASLALGRRWPGTQVPVVNGLPVEAILSRARGSEGGAIVLGSRGHGALGRLLLGSVSRDVVRRSRWPVLVVKGRARVARRLVIGVDGSAAAREAVELVRRLSPPRRGLAILVHVIEPVRLPSVALLPASLRAVIGAEAAALRARRAREARRELEAAAGRLRRAGWRSQTLLRVGVPAAELVDAIRATGADGIVVGARGVGGLERLLLGSVAGAVLAGSPVPVLVVR